MWCINLYSQNLRKGNITLLQRQRFSKVIIKEKASSKKRESGKRLKSHLHPVLPTSTFYVLISLGITSPLTCNKLPLTCNKLTKITQKNIHLKQFLTENNMNPHEASRSDNVCTCRDWVQVTACKNHSSSPFSHFGIKHAEKKHWSNVLSRFRKHN